MNATYPWQQIIPQDAEAIRHGTEQYHHAVQFIALVGKSLLPERADDSQTNLEWWPDRSCFAGRRLSLQKPVYLVFDTRSFELVGYTFARHPGEKLFLGGLNREEIMEWVKKWVLKNGGDPEKLEFISHYELPEHTLALGAKFSSPAPEVQEALAIYRSNAENLLAQFAVKFFAASSVRIWPHHFDTGSYIPLQFDEKGNPTQSMGIGLAIPQPEIPDYHFYINHWRKSGNPAYTSLPELQGGGIWHTGDWTGAVLRMETIAKFSDAAEQFRAVVSFFETGIEATIKLLKES